MPRCLPLLFRSRMCFPTLFSVSGRGPAVTGPIAWNGAWFWVLSPGLLPGLCSAGREDSLRYPNSLARSERVMPFDRCSLACLSCLLGTGQPLKTGSGPWAPLDLGFFLLPMVCADVVTACPAPKRLLQMRSLTPHLFYRNRPTHIDMLNHLSGYPITISLWEFYTSCHDQFMAEHYTMCIIPAAVFWASTESECHTVQTNHIGYQLSRTTFQ